MGSRCAAADPILGALFCSTNSVVIAVGDVLRVICFVGGAVVAATYVRILLDKRVRIVSGLIWRLTGAAAASAFVCITEYERLNDAVTPRLLLGVLTIVAFAIGFIRYTPPDLSLNEARLTYEERNRLFAEQQRDQDDAT